MCLKIASCGFNTAIVYLFLSFYLTNYISTKKRNLKNRVYMTSLNVYDRSCGGFQPSFTHLNIFDGYYYIINERKFLYGIR